MIWYPIFSLIFYVFDWVLSFLPDVTWSIDTSVISYFYSFVEIVFYLLPMGTVAFIIKMIVSFIWFRIGIALIRTVWDLLPVV